MEQAPSLRTVHSTRIVLALLAFVLLTGATWPAAVVAQQSARHIVWNRIDVVVQLRDNGSLHVIERDQVHFSGKPPFRRGFRDIPWARIDRIANVSVSGVSGTELQTFSYVSPEDFSLNTPYTYTYQNVGANLRIEWTFPPTTESSRTFQLEFDADGVLRVYNDPQGSFQQLNWAAVDRELTKDAPVNTATLTIILPRPITPDDAYFEGPGSTQWQAHTQDGQSWTWVAHDLGSGDSLGVILRFPALVSAQKPSWQDGSDWYERLTSAEFMLVSLGLAIVVLALGGLTMLAVWWWWGRDPEIGPMPEYVTEPPGTLPPAIVGALVDERVDERDIVATLVDLARRGVLRIATPQGGVWDDSESDFTISMLQSAEPVTPFERALLFALFDRDLRPGQPVSLEVMGARFKATGGDLRDSLYSDLVQHGFFSVAPPETQAMWKWVEKGIWLVALFGFWMFVSFLPPLPVTFWAILGALFLLSVLVRHVAKAMPRKTVSGAETAAKYRAFKRYLERINAFEDLSQAQDVFDRYLPYAIAFGLEGAWVDEFSQVQTPTPTWFRGLHSVSFPPMGDAGSISIGSASGDTIDVTSLQAMSTTTAESLQENANALFSWFNSASETFGVQSAQRSSGFSGSVTGLRIGLAIFRGMSGGGGGGFS